MPVKKSKVVSSVAAFKPQSKFGRYKVSPKEDRTVDGIVFDSKWEAKVYTHLIQFIPKEHIHMQVPFLLQPKFKLAGTSIREVKYVADFVLSTTPLVHEDNKLTSIPACAVIVDAKGHLTDIFKLKNKMFMYTYQVPIVQVKRPADVQDLVDKYMV